MIKFELGMTEPAPSRARNSALTIALSYVAGGLIPLAPYVLLQSVQSTLLGYVIVTVPEGVDADKVKASFKNGGA